MKQLRVAGALVAVLLLAWIAWQTIHAGSDIPSQTTTAQTQLAGGSANDKRIDGKSWSLDYDNATLSPDGSLALGGVLGMIAVLIHQPLVLVLAGGVFVAEAGSVLIQRGWFKYTRYKYGQGRRVFLMAPLHHHFEKMGWYESQVVTRFYILCVLCAVVALSTLKIR